MHVLRTILRHGCLLVVLSPVCEAEMLTAGRGASDHRSENRATLHTTGIASHLGLRAQQLLGAAQGCAALRGVDMFPQVS